LLDRAYDDQAFWGVVWDQRDQLVVRLKHLDRLSRAPDAVGRWRETRVEPCSSRLAEITRFKTELRMRIGRQKTANLQEVTVILYGGPTEVSCLVGESLRDTIFGPEKTPQPKEDAGEGDCAKPKR
jgi:hypothetical protein